ncbi:MAG: VOC family protein [Thermoleophilaceae bacterium]
MNPKIDLITIGAKDLERTRTFYERGLGCPVENERDDRVTFRLGPTSSKLALRPWDALAGDAGLPGESSGFRGFALSYIVERAADVDAVIERAARSGGEVSKPPRRAFWGYSAYVTDPSGYLWKVASPKRRPLIRKEEPAEAVAAEEIALTIGVGEMKRAKQFYADGLGCPVKKDYSKFVMFDGGRTPDLAMYQWDALADDAGVEPAGSGFRGFAMSHIVDSAASVDAVLRAVTSAGGKTLGRNGYFTDPDGYLWNVTT